MVFLGHHRKITCMAHSILPLHLYALVLLLFFITDKKVVNLRKKVKSITNVNTVFLYSIMSLCNQRLLHNDISPINRVTYYTRSMLYHHQTADPQWYDATKLDSSVHQTQSFNPRVNIKAGCILSSDCKC